MSPQHRPARRRGRQRLLQPHRTTDAHRRPGPRRLAVIDPTRSAVAWWVPLPGCDRNHGLNADPAHRLGFVACDDNATLLAIDLDTWQILDTQRVGDDPDVLAYDAPAGPPYISTSPPKAAG
jgi:hypothetical protein